MVDSILRMGDAKAKAAGKRGALRRSVGSGKEQTAASRLLRQVEALARANPGLSAGLTAVARQYERPAARAAMQKDPLVWKGVDERVIEVMLKEVYPRGVRKKLEPLYLEWILRRLAADRKDMPLSSPAAVRSWASMRGFRCAPISATKSKSTPSRVAYALARWDPVNNADGSWLTELPAQARHARVGLVEACGLFVPEAPPPAGDCKQRSLTDFFAKTLVSAPTAAALAVAAIGAEAGAEASAVGDGPNAENGVGIDDAVAATTPSTPHRRRRLVRELSTPKMPAKIGRYIACTPCFPGPRTWRSSSP